MDVKIINKIKNNFTGKYRGAAYSISNLKFTEPNDIPAVFHSGSNYENHFILKELANQFRGQIECLGENMKNYKIFSVLIE